MTTRMFKCQGRPIDSCMYPPSRADRSYRHPPSRHHPNIVSRNGSASGALLVGKHVRAPLDQELESTVQAVPCPSSRRDPYSHGLVAMDIRSIEPEPCGPANTRNGHRQTCREHSMVGEAGLHQGQPVDGAKSTPDQDDRIKRSNMLEQSKCSMLFNISATTEYSCWFGAGTLL